jgi:Condensation domain
MTDPAKTPIPNLDTSKLAGRRLELLHRLLQARPDSVPKAAEIHRRESGTTVPVSFGQRQIWLHARFSPDLPIYNEPVTIHRFGTLDVKALENAFHEIVKHHEIWRTTFRWEGDEIIQVVHESPKRIVFPFLDVSAHPPELREKIAIRSATWDALRPFDLETGPLYRPRLVKFSEEEHRLYLTLHHIIFDGVSLYQVFLPQFCAAYEAFAQGRASPIEPPPIQFGDYAIWHRGHVTKLLEEQLEWWRERLNGAKSHVLSTDFPRPEVQSFRGQMEPVALSAKTNEAIKALGRREGATLFMTVLATCYALLYCHTGEEDLVIGIASSGRSRVETEKLIGFLLNTIAVRTGFSSQITFRELLARTRQSTLEALAHDDVPFEFVVRQLQRCRLGDKNPVFQFLFSLEPPLASLGPGWKFTQMDVETGAAKFDLHLELDDRRDGIIGRFLYNTDLFRPETIRNLLSDWQSIIEIVADNPGIQLHQLAQSLKTEVQSTDRSMSRSRAGRWMSTVRAKRRPDRSGKRL